jgi:hypothetical protein
LSRAASLVGLGLEEFCGAAAKMPNVNSNTTEAKTAEMDLMNARALPQGLKPLLLRSLLRRD